MANCWKANAVSLRYTQIPEVYETEKKISKIMIHESPFIIWFLNKVLVSKYGYLYLFAFGDIVELWKILLGTIVRKRCN